MTTIMRNMGVAVCLLIGAICLADDPISNLTERLNSEVGGLWMNGMQPGFTLPATSSATQVVAAAAQAWRMTKRTNDTLRIVDIREVKINGPLGSPWKAALIECSAGRKILLFRALGENRWWTRFYDVTDSAVAWGPEIDGLQVGLVPIGRGTDGELAWRSDCPDCAGAVERRLWSGACDVCGAKASYAHCESCRAALRLCDRCKKVRPVGSRFAAGDALVFEVHIRNVAKKDVEVAEVDSACWGLFFRPKKETLGAEDGWEAEFKQLNRKASPDPMLIPPGGHHMRFWVVGPGGEQASFVSLRRKDADVAANLPAGDYAATVVLRRGSGNEARYVTSGPVMVAISTATHGSD